MNAAQFNAIFDEVVSPPLIAVGFVQNGRRLRYEDDTIQAALVRTESRWIPPARFTFVFRHRFLRDRMEVVPSVMPTEPNDSPIKVAPSDLVSVTSGTWRYAPIMNKPPSDPIDYPRLPESEVRLALARLAADVVSAFPVLAAALSPTTIRSLIVSRGHEAWGIERLWLDDYDRYLSEVTDSGRP